MEEYKKRIINNLDPWQWAKMRITWEDNRPKVKAEGEGEVPYKEKIKDMLSLILLKIQDPELKWWKFKK